MWLARPIPSGACSEVGASHIAAVLTSSKGHGSRVSTVVGGSSKLIVQLIDARSDTFPGINHLTVRAKAMKSELINSTTS